MKSMLIIGCAAPPVLHIGALADMVKQRGWMPSIVLTPVASSWVRPEQLAEQGHVVQVEPRLPHQPKGRTAKPDLIVVAPATFNTINKVAAGMADNLALSILCEALVSGPPIIFVPCAKPSLRAHPAFGASTERLANCGSRYVELTGHRDEGGLVRFDWTELTPQLTMSPQ